MPKIIEKRLSGVNYAAIGLASLSLALGGCDRPSDKDASIDQIAAPEAITLGKVDETTFFLKSVDSRQFLITDAINNNCIIEHLPNSEMANPDTFKVQIVEGEMGDGHLYIVELDGLQYAYLDGFSGGEIIRLSSRE